jgi:hypothetical protein
MQSSVSPQQRAVSARWIIPALAPSERATLLGGMRQKMPAPAFAAILELVRPHLSPRDWDKLMRALAPVPQAA